MAEFGASSESKVSKHDTPTFVIQLLTTFKFLLLKNFMLGQRDRPSSFSTCDIHTRVHHSRYNLRIAIFSVIVGWLTPDIYLLPPSFPNSVYLYSPQTSLSKLSNISRHLPMPPSQRCVQGCVGCIINHSLHGSHRPLRRSSRAPLLARPSIAIRAYRHIEPDHHSNSLQSSFVVRKALSHCGRQNQALSLGLAELGEPSASPGNSYSARRRQRGGGMGNVIFEKGCQAFGRCSIIRVFPQGTRKPFLSVPKAFPCMFAFALASVQNPVPDVVSTRILSRNVSKHSGGPVGRHLLFWTSTL